MRHYQRFLPLADQQIDSPDEPRRLSEMLIGAPGISGIEILGRHPKGGYRVTFDLQADALDGFISYIHDNGWMTAI
jgi:hypothetical protein